MAAPLSRCPLFVPCLFSVCSPLPFSYLAFTICSQQAGTNLHFNATL